jgi:hypothetical protein
MGRNSLHELYHVVQVLGRLLGSDFQGNPFTCPQPPIALEYVADGVFLDNEITLPLYVAAGIFACPAIGLGVCFDGLVGKFVRLFDIKDRPPPLASGPSEMQCISPGVISGCKFVDIKEAAKW